MPFDLKSVVSSVFGGGEKRRSEPAPVQEGPTRPATSAKRDAAQSAEGFDAQESALAPQSSMRPKARPTAAPATSIRPKARPEGLGGTANDPRYQVDEGQLTFDVEGLENPGRQFHSRVPHWPGSWSGVTIGRGYDMKERSVKEVKTHLRAAGVEEPLVSQLAAGAGLKGNKAKAFCRKHRSLEITPEQQKNLFAVVYGEKEAYARDRIKEWTGTDLDAAEQPVQDLLVDLFYRGDMTYKKWKRHGFARLVSTNNYEGLIALIGNKGLWGNIDQNRYVARIRYMRNAERARK